MPSSGASATRWGGSPEDSKVAAPPLLRGFARSVSPAWRAQAGEVIAVLQMAMLAGLPYTRLRDAIFKYPTMAEGLNGPVCERPSDETAGRGIMKCNRDEAVFGGLLIADCDARIRIGDPGRCVLSRRPPVQRGQNNRQVVCRLTSMAEVCHYHANPRGPAAPTFAAYSSPPPHDP
jgi:hypothetical protein